MRVTSNKLLLLLSILGCCSGCRRPSAPFPDVSQIKSIHVSVIQLDKRNRHAFEIARGDRRDVQFDITEHFEPILEALQPNELDAHPAKWEVVGSLRIHDRDGQSTWIDLFGSSRPQVPFKIGDHYYLGGSFEKLAAELLARMPSKH